MTGFFGRSIRDINNPAVSAEIPPEKTVYFPSDLITKPELGLVSETVQQVQPCCKQFSMHPWSTNDHRQ